MSVSSDLNKAVKEKRKKAAWKSLQHAYGGSRALRWIYLMGSVARVRQHLEFMCSLNFHVQWPSESRAVTQSHQPQKHHCCLSNSQLFPQKWVVERGKKFTLILVCSPQQLQAIISLSTKCYVYLKNPKKWKRKLIRHEGAIQALSESSASSSANPLIPKYSQIQHGTSWAEMGQDGNPITLWDSACKKNCGQIQCD